MREQLKAKCRRASQDRDTEFMIPVQCTDEREEVAQGTSTVAVSALNGSGHPLLVL